MHEAQPDARASSAERMGTSTRSVLAHAQPGSAFQRRRASVCPCKSSMTMRSEPFAASSSTRSNARTMPRCQRLAVAGLRDESARARRPPRCARARALWPRRRRAWRGCARTTLGPCRRRRGAAPAGTFPRGSPPRLQLREATTPTLARARGFGVVSSFCLSIGGRLRESGTRRGERIPPQPNRAEIEAERSSRPLIRSARRSWQWLAFPGRFVTAVARLRASADGACVVRCPTFE